MAKKNNAIIYMTAFVLMLAGLGGLVYSGVKKDSVYFVTVSEALAMEPSQLSQARLFGMVAAEDLTRFDHPAGVGFNLVDKDDRTKVVRVEYKGVVPDTFKPGMEVIVEGGLTQEENVFKAGVLMTKCPSKYEKRKAGE